MSVIVLMHNNVSMSARCLQSLSPALAGLDHEVILLDNASTEDVAPLADFSSLFRRFKILRIDENLTFSKVNNRAACETTGKWLLFLNNDVFLHPDAVRKLIAHFECDPKTGVVGGKLLFPDEQGIQHAGISQMLWDHPSNFGVMAGPADPRVAQCCERFALSGAMLCVPAELFRLVGGFDDRYVWGTEDIDLCLKIRSAGFRVVYCHEASGIHVESATLKVTRRWDPQWNCRLYRETWNWQLVPREHSYVRKLKKQGIRRVGIFGLGSAARGLARILDQDGIEVAAFTASRVDGANSFLGRPLLPLESLRHAAFDRLMVASQYFFQVESTVREIDPLRDPIYPVVM